MIRTTSIREFAPASGVHGRIWKMLQLMRTYILIETTINFINRAHDY